MRRGVAPAHQESDPRHRGAGWDVAAGDPGGSGIVGCVTGGGVPEGYLAGLPAGQRELLAAANADGLAALVGLLAAREAAAFLGAGVSVPLYPLWGHLAGFVAVVGVPTPAA